MELPAKNEDYRKKEYWDSRYETEDKYDWFSGYTAFQHLIRSDVKQSDTILMLGCGNSTLSDDMYNDGFKHITNMDFSSVVIKRMAEKHASQPEMKWVVMDIMDMTFEDESFDIIIEKGTLDALKVHEKDPWNTSDETKTKIDIILEKVSSILKPGGKFISVTFAQPHFRRPFYARAKYNWSVELKSFGSTFHFFYFVMQKGCSLSEKDRVEELNREAKLSETNDNASVQYIEEDLEDFILGMEV